MSVVPPRLIGSQTAVSLCAEGPEGLLPAQLSHAGREETAPQTSTCVYGGCLVPGLRHEATGVVLRHQVTQQSCAGISSTLIFELSSEPQLSLPLG